MARPLTAIQPSCQRFDTRASFSSSRALSWSNSARTATLAYTSAELFFRNTFPRNSLQCHAFFDAQNRPAKFLCLCARESCVRCLIVILDFKFLNSKPQFTILRNGNDSDYRIRESAFERIGID